MVMEGTSIIDQRTVIFQAYMLLLGDEDRYTKFKSRDISEVTGVDTVHVSALIMKCIKVDLIRRVGKDGRAQLYELTDRGISRGEFYFKNYNSVTNTLTQR